ncbi:hypothetical protein CDD83_161 [Cordyceps sp. RAO-2017]|nr:hypothetical protein CDD83_161 [Cordyceps sp. RAO-2017]
MRNEEPPELGQGQDMEIPALQAIAMGQLALAQSFYSRIVQVEQRQEVLESQMQKLEQSQQRLRQTWQEMLPVMMESMQRTEKLTTKLAAQITQLADLVERLEGQLNEG